MKRETILGIALVIVLAAIFVFADPGNYCFTSPCTCGAACQNGGDEAANSYNTIDSCRDGTQDTYEYVHDIIVASLNDSVFRALDTVQIQATVDCDLGGDEITIAYSSGAGWKPIYNNVCAYDGKRTYYRNHTLENSTGNHTIRVITAYNGIQNMTCGYTHDTLYSDTDDLGFFVYWANQDLDEPRTMILHPVQDKIFAPSDNLVINMTVNVTDESTVNVTANITWGNSVKLLSLTDIGNRIFAANFTNTSDIAWYHLEITSVDLWGNINKTYSSFLINITLNVTITYPTEGALYPSTMAHVEFELTPNTEPLSAWVEQIDFDDYHASNIYIGNSDSNGNSTNDALPNISQQFLFDRDTYSQSISLNLAKHGVGESYAYVLNGTNPMAYAQLDGEEEAKWTNFTLNQTVFFAANKTYVLFISNTLNPGDYFSFELSNDTYLGNCSLGQDIQFRVFDKYRFNSTFGVDDNDFSYIAHADTNLGHLQSSIVTAHYDFDPPEIEYFGYTPTGIFSLDPNSDIKFRANITDNVQTQIVYLYYKRENESSYQNITMQEISQDLFEANLSFANELNFSAYIQAYDSSGYDSVSGEESIELTYDRNWTVLPKSVNITGILINRNVTISNFTVISYSDFPLTFNISATGGLEVLFNGSINETLELAPNSQASYNVTIKASSLPQEDLISIRVTANDSSAAERNFTVISYLSGPYLYADIIEYSAQVTLGGHIPSIKAKIWNVGNETASNILARWSIPQDWESRDVLVANFSNLTSGALEFVEFQISADVPSTAQAGDKTIAVYVNCSENRTAYDSRSVTVSQETVSSNTDSGSSGGKGNSYGIVLGGNDLFVSLNTTLIPRGQNFSAMLTVINNISHRDYKNMGLEIEGLFSSYYSKIEKFDLGYMEKIELPLTFAIPGYHPEGEIDAELVFHMNSTIIRKPIKLTVYDQKTSLKECLQSAIWMISQMDYIKVWDHDPSDYINSTDPIAARQVCNEISSYYNSYIEFVDDLLALESDADRLEGEGYNTTSMRSYIILSKEALGMGNIAKAKELLSQGRLFMENAAVINRPLEITIEEFVKDNLQTIIMFMIFTPVSMFLTMKIVQVTKKENRIKRLIKEKQRIISLLATIQDEHFNEKLIDKKLYSAYMHEYQKQIGKINVMLIRLKVCSQSQQQSLKSLLIEAQKDYYEKAIIDHKSFLSIERIIRAELQKFENSAEEGSKPKKALSENLEEGKKRDIKITQNTSQAHSITVAQEHAFNLVGKGKISSINSLIDALKIMDEETFSYHNNSQKNDFYNWIRDTISEKIAEKIKDIKAREEMISALEAYHEA